MNLYLLDAANVYRDNEFTWWADDSHLYVSFPTVNTVTLHRVPREREPAKVLAREEAHVITECPNGAIVMVDTSVLAVFARGRGMGTREGVNVRDAYLAAFKGDVAGGGAGEAGEAVEADAATGHDSKRMRLDTGVGAGAASSSASASAASTQDDLAAARAASLLTAMAYYGSDAVGLKGALADFAAKHPERKCGIRVSLALLAFAPPDVIRALVDAGFGALDDLATAVLFADPADAWSSALVAAVATDAEAFKAEATKIMGQVRKGATRQALEAVNGTILQGLGAASGIPPVDAGACRALLAQEVKKAAAAATQAYEAAGLQVDALLDGARAAILAAGIAAASAPASFVHPLTHNTLTLDVAELYHATTGVVFAQEKVVNLYKAAVARADAAAVVTREPFKTMYGAAAAAVRAAVLAVHPHGDAMLEGKGFEAQVARAVSERLCRLYDAAIYDERPSRDAFLECMQEATEPIRAAHKAAMAAWKVALQQCIPAAVPAEAVAAYRAAQVAGLTAQQAGADAFVAWLKRKQLADSLSSTTYSYVSNARGRQWVQGLQERAAADPVFVWPDEARAWAAAGRGIHEDRITAFVETFVIRAPTAAERSFGQWLQQVRPADAAAVVAACQADPAWAPVAGTAPTPKTWAAWVDGVAAQEAYAPVAVQHRLLASKVKDQIAAWLRRRLDAAAAVPPTPATV